MPKTECTSCIPSLSTDILSHLSYLGTYWTSPFVPRASSCEGTRTFHPFVDKRYSSGKASERGPLAGEIGNMLRNVGAG